MNTHEHEPIFPGAKGWQIFNSEDILKAMKKIQSEWNEQKEKEKNKSKPKHIWPGYEDS